MNDLFSSTSPIGMSIFRFTCHHDFYAPHGAYGAAVECIDWATGVLLFELARLGLDKNTLIIFTSDNGSRNRDEGGSNAPLRGTKATTWEGGQRVPCIMRRHSRIPPGTVCGEITTAMDFFPTLAALCGIDIPDDRIIDGKDISPLMFAYDSASSPHDAFFFYREENLEAVRSGKWKLHVRKGTEEVNELYNLDADIGETHNLYNQYPDIVESLLEKIDSCRKELGDAATGIKGVKVRPIGRVDQPDTLTHFDPSHPYIIALYDLKDRG